MPDRTVVIVRLSRMVSGSAVGARTGAIREAADGHRIVLARLVLGVLFGCWAVLFIVRTSVVALDGAVYYVLFDDAMISMRYAWNLSHGHGLVWNVGEPVEGYTNLLMTLLMALPTDVLPARLAALPVQLLGLMFVLVSAYLTASIARQVAGAGPLPGQVMGLLAFAGVITCYPLAYWSLMGMETGLLTMLLLAAVALMLRMGPHPQRGQLIGLGMVWGLCYLTRPDAVIFDAVLAAYLTWGAVRGGASLREAAHPVLLAGAVLAAVIGAQLLFRVTMYGQLVPNTYILKLEGVPLGIRLLNGIGFLLPFFSTAALLMLTATVGVLTRPSPPKMLLGSLFAWAVVYQIWTGGDPWPLWRMVAPTLPLLIVLAICGAAEYARRLPAQVSVVGGRWRVTRVGMTGVLIASGVLLLDQPFVGQILGLEPPYQVAANQANVDRALALAAVTGPSASLGVFWAGSVVFFSDRYGIDFLGKSDPYVAHLAPDLSGAISWSGMSSVPGHNKYDLHYSIEYRRPTYVEDFQWGRQDLRQRAEQAYRLVHYRGIPLWLRKDSPDVRWDLVTS